MATHTPAAPTATSPPTSCCPRCGSVATQTQSQSRIAELEARVAQLNQEAAVAVSRWADYEAELHRLRSAQRPPPPSTPPPQQQQAEPSPRQSPSSTASTSILHKGTSRLSSLLRADVRRQNSSPLPHPPLSPGAASAEDLMEALTREQALRREAEGRLSATSKEVEELSVSLFEQANEMVADERRARARLEERVGELEKRDEEKRRRLERLEGAMGRIEKVRTLLEES
ncbi:hypothetical protein EsDP_00003751 [Epichloe bromicola]|uniref:GDP/GTP exchange factor Sec2 N-terminal domain-containing protein n=1 Tax=Epichloe bromicola TaxID=79588 RepID=A0ABQ0CPQ9_9HYPO